MLNWLRCRLSFALLRSGILCLRGARTLRPANSASDLRQPDLAVVGAQLQYIKTRLSTCLFPSLKAISLQPVSTRFMIYVTFSYRRLIDVKFFYLCVYLQVLGFSIFYPRLCPRTWMLCRCQIFQVCVFLVCLQLHASDKVGLEEEEEEEEDSARRRRQKVCRGVNALGPSFCRRQCIGVSVVLGPYAHAAAILSCRYGPHEKIFNHEKSGWVHLI